MGGGGSHEVEPETVAKVEARKGVWMGLSLGVSSVGRSMAGGVFY